MTYSSSLMQKMENLGVNARKAALTLALTSDAQKNRALLESAKALRAARTAILEANAQDLKNAKEKGLSVPLQERLTLTPERIEAMANGLEDITQLEDPVGKTLASWERPNGLKIKRISTPLGVIGVIFESRPNVTADAGALCLKSGNAAILRGGSDSWQSSKTILTALQIGLEAANLPPTCIQMVPSHDREAVGILLSMDKSIDVIIPRGGRGLIERIRKEARMPVFSHLDGLCHTYVDQDANLQHAQKIVFNAKMRRTSICGATETLLVHQSIAQDLLPPLCNTLQKHGCLLRGCKRTCTIVPMQEATEEDWSTEYLDAILSIKIVDSAGEAIEHINSYGSHHTEAILSENPDTLSKFANEVDAGIIMQNTSTQYADGAEFGMGAEIGISTGKMHARGPVGAAQLTSYKYLVEGQGQVRP